MVRLVVAETWNCGLGLSGVFFSSWVESTAVERTLSGDTGVSKGPRRDLKGTNSMGAMLEDMQAVDAASVRLVRGKVRCKYYGLSEHDSDQVEASLYIVLQKLIYHDVQGCVFRQC